MNLYLRQSRDSDIPLVMAWRSSPLVFNGFYTQREPLKWKEHYNWWMGRNKDWYTLIAVLTEDGIDRPIGVVTIGQCDHYSPEFGYYLGEISLAHQPQHYGTTMVNKALDWLKEYQTTHPHIKGVHTTILDSNTASIKLIKKLGFIKGMPARKGEHYYYREI